MDKIEPGAGKATSDNQPEVSKKKYVKPELIEYGTLAKLTRGGGGGGNDGGSPTMICL
jgi:hypothetical protein